ncbi:multicopper oxidase domain-containing protein [Catellatospora sp. KI3]|uniref:multicopper oxidase family protein n=1 Tax=Catellatospora sp. KI3 TaxID=3041620 RepID=UPI002482A8D1|nr:multicopper oxidase domain-containing protein [Catellatospora sp. KI3]MDI1465984.1 multicopper oxidase domain-containing protein [Catellatospora sp. KI3]
MRLRRVLVVLLAAVLVLCGLCAGAGVWVWSGAVLSTADEVDFVRPLAVPPLAPSRLDAQGRRVFELTARAGTHDFGHGQTPTWGYGGSYLGPTLRAARGEQVVVDVANTLGEATTLHWHGMHLPAAMDGGPYQGIEPGTTWSPTWRIDQPAATLWYHPHPHGRTAQHVYRGLAGMFLVDDPATDVAALPHEYGVDDFPVIVQDKKFDGDGGLDDAESFLSGTGLLGDTVAVNGTVGPYLEVSTRRVRLRLLNASNARSYDFGFTDGRTFALVGSDGGLLPQRVDLARVMLSPGERAEIVVTVAPGERAVLRSYPQALGTSLVDRFTGGADTLDILQLRVSGDAAARPEVPQRLVDVPRLDPAGAAQRRTFKLGERSINGKGMAATRVDAAPVLGTTEVWQVVNNDGTPHNFHVHDVQFQVASVGGQAPPPWLAGWKDTVYLPPNRPYELVMRFTDYADPNTAYMFHCHLLSHEDSGMMGQFVVLPPATTPGAGSG